MGLALLVEVAKELASNDRVTPAGLCYLMRDMDLTYAEAQDALDSLTGTGMAERQPDTGFGPEYLPTDRLKTWAARRTPKGGESP